MFCWCARVVVNSLRLFHCNCLDLLGSLTAIQRQVCGIATNQVLETIFCVALCIHLQSCSLLCVL